jgi:hypothetical protein
MQHILEPPGFKGVSSSPLTYYQHLQAHLSIERHLHKLMSASENWNCYPWRGYLR